MKLPRASPGSLTCSVYSTVTQDLGLTLSPIHTHFNKLKEKNWENMVENGEIAQNEQFHVFSTMFSMQSVSLNPLIATF